MSTGSSSNGVIRIGRKGIKKFAFGDDGTPFDVDIVVAFQEWISIDDSFRPLEVSEDGSRTVPLTEMAAYHQAAVDFATRLAYVGLSGLSHNAREFAKDAPNQPITPAEALDFIARLREQYDELADFFRPKSRQKPDLQDTSEVELRFSEEQVQNLPTSTN